jgi:hypothetical protein
MLFKVPKVLGKEHVFFLMGLIMGDPRGEHI